jgi:hypothetical protein
MLQQKTTVIDLNWLLSCSGILIPPVRRATVYVFIAIIKKELKLERYCTKHSSLSASCFSRKTG